MWFTITFISVTEMSIIAIIGINSMNGTIPQYKSYFNE